MRKQVAGIAIAAALGVSGGLVAALAFHPSNHRFHFVAAPTSALPKKAKQLSASDATVMTVETPALKPLRNDEVDRLKTRNRRLEALVSVLRQREHNRAPSTSQGN